MANKKKMYICNVCGAEAIKWQGQCYECKEWNTLIEVLNQNERTGIHSSRKAWVCPPRE